MRSLPLTISLLACLISPPAGLASPCRSNDLAVLVGDAGEAVAVPLAAALEEGRRSGIGEAWVWSPERAPRRLRIARLANVAELEPDPRLTVRIVSRRQRRPPEPAPAACLIAAPLAMWDQVPESTLPSWPIAETGDAVSIPIDRTRPWRLRLVGTTEGSWWIDVAAGAGEAVVIAHPAGDRAIAVGDRQGAAIDGAVVRFFGRRDQGAGGARLTWRRADTGTAVFPRLPSLEPVSAMVAAPGFAPRWLEGSPGELPARVMLARGHAVSGRFVDGDDKPVAEVRVISEAWLDREGAVLDRREAVSDGAGRWRIEGLPAGTLRLMATARDRAPLRAEVTLAGRDLDLGRIVVAQGAALAVAVTDDRDEPVAGASVEAGPDRGAITDRHGIAELRGLAEGAVTLAISAPGHLPVERSETVPGAGEVAVVLTRAAVVAGRLVDPDGRPVADAIATVRMGSRDRSQRLEPDGTFRLSLPPRRELELTVRAPSILETGLRLRTGAAGSERDLGDLVAERGLTVSGRAIAGDASPAAGVAVWTPRTTDRGEVVAWARGDVLRAIAGADGSFELSGLRREPLVLRLEGQGFARRHLELDPGALEAESGALDLGEIVLDRGARLRVFTDPDHGPLQARVDLRQRWLDLDMLSAPVHDGRAVFEHVPVGEATVSILDGWEVVCEERISVERAGENVDLDCQADTRRIAGTVLVGGRPAGDGRLLWSSATDPAPPGLIMRRTSPLGLERRQAFGLGRPPVEVTVLGGRFETERLRSGAWEVTWMPARGAISPPERIELPALDTVHEVVVAFAGHALAGTVIDERGQPVVEARIRSSSGAFATSGVDGSFRLTNLEAGRHDVVARHGDRRSRVHSVALEDGAPPEPLVLEVGAGDQERVEIRVVDENGAAAAGAFVYLEELGGRSRILTADATGFARAALHPPLPRRLRAAAVHGGRWAFGQWVDTEDAVAGVQLFIEPVGSLRLVGGRTGGPASVVAESDWDLAWLLARLGRPTTVPPREAVELHGLPAGRYRVATDGFATTVAVRAHELAEVEIP